MSAAGARAEALRHLSGRIFDNARPDRLGVAVSGGGDSMALLDLMAWHAAGAGFALEAVTVDHGLRPEAADEAAFVGAHCAARGIPHEVLRWDRGTGAGNLSARARDARYGLIADWARRRGIGQVALGHTRDDLAETFLMRLARGSGVDGLAGMEPQFTRHGIGWSRPLLQAGRDALRAYLRDAGIDWCEDPTNDDPAYDRARTRKLLETLAPLGIDVETLADTGQRLRAAKAALRHYARQEAPRLVRQEAGDLILDRAPQPPVPEETAHRLLVAALQWVSGTPYPPRQAALVEMEAALAQADSFTLAGCLVTREAPGVLRIAREWGAVRDLACATDQPWDGRWRLSGPHAPGLEIRALGDAVSQVPDWRETGLPRASLRAAPAIWAADRLIAAPMAGLSQGWTAELVESRCDFVAYQL